MIVLRVLRRRMKRDFDLSGQQPRAYRVRRADGRQLYPYRRGGTFVTCAVLRSRLTLDREHRRNKATLHWCLDSAFERVLRYWHQLQRIPPYVYRGEGAASLRLRSIRGPLVMCRSAPWPQRPRTLRQRVQDAPTTTCRLRPLPRRGALRRPTAAA